MSTIHDTPGSDLEARLRDEFSDRAANATGADRILTALAKQPIELRPRRTRAIGRWAVAAAAVAVVLAGVPIGLHLFGHGQSPTITATPDVASEPKDIVYDLTYQPTWLPANFTTDARTSSADGAEQRWEWSDPDADTLPADIQLNVWSTATALGQGQAHQIQTTSQTTTVNGHRASLVSQPQYAAVSWQPTPDAVILVSASGLPDVTTTAEKVAGQLVAVDPANPITVTAGLTFGTLPTGYQPYAQAAGGNQARPTRTIQADNGPSSANKDLTAELTPSGSPLPLPAGPTTPATMRGRTGRYVASGGETAVTVQLADGFWLTVVSSPSSYPNHQVTALTKDQLIAIADNITIDPHPDLSWLGR